MFFLSVKRRIGKGSRLGGASAHPSCDNGSVCDPLVRRFLLRQMRGRESQRPRSCFILSPLGLRFSSSGSWRAGRPSPRQPNGRNAAHSPPTLQHPTTLLTRPHDRLRHLTRIVDLAATPVKALRRFAIETAAGLSLPRPPHLTPPAPSAPSHSPEPSAPTH